MEQPHGGLGRRPRDPSGRPAARLHGVRLLADGIWLNTAGNGIALSDEDTDAIRALAHHLIQENS